MSLFSYLKVAIVSLFGIVLTILGFRYKRAVNKAENLEKENEIKDKQLKVQEAVHKDEVNNIKLERDVEKSIVEENKKTIKNNNSYEDKIRNTKDGEEYEITL